MLTRKHSKTKSMKMMKRPIAAWIASLPCAAAAVFSVIAPTKTDGLGVWFGVQTFAEFRVDNLGCTSARTGRCGIKGRSRSRVGVCSRSR